MIPAGGQISFAEIAEKTGLEKRELRRLLEHAMAMRILRSPEPEMVAHTKVSKFLTIPYISAWVNFESKDTWPATTRVSLHQFWHLRKDTVRSQTLLCRRSSTLCRSGQARRKPAKR